MKIITLCECGLGTSYLLKYTVEKALRVLNLTAEVITSSAASGPEEADLYIMPFGLNPQVRMGVKTNYIMIRNVMDVDEVIACLKERS